MPALIDRSGERFSRLTVISKAPSKMRGGKLRPYWLCRCDCGAEIVVMGESLSSGNTQSCGCAKTGDWFKTHEMSDTKTYNAWAAAKSRCSNPNHPSYKHYGGRGISVCQRWRDSFEAFLEDMGVAPADLELFRDDVNGNYEPGNCRWATRREQILNQRWVGKRPA